MYGVVSTDGRWMCWRVGYETKVGLLGRYEDGIAKIVAFDGCEMDIMCYCWCYWLQCIYIAIRDESVGLTLQLVNHETKPIGGIGESVRTSATIRHSMPITSIAVNRKIVSGGYGCHLVTRLKSFNHGFPPPPTHTNDGPKPNSVYCYMDAACRNLYSKH